MLISMLSKQSRQQNMLQILAPVFFFFLGLYLKPEMTSSSPAFNLYTYMCVSCVCMPWVIAFCLVFLLESINLMKCVTFLLFPKFKWQYLCFCCGWLFRCCLFLVKSSSVSVCFSVLQKYRHHDEDSSPQDQSSPQLTEEAGGPELVQVAEKNLSEIENVHGYVTHAHISPMKVGRFCCLFVFLSLPCSIAALPLLMFFFLSVRSKLHDHSWDLEWVTMGAFLLVFQPYTRNGKDL